MLTELEKKILASIQNDISITKQPFLEIAKKIGITEETLLDKLKDLCDRGIIRRFGATIRHQQSGFAANAMVAWDVDDKRINDVGQKMAFCKEVSHCYSRNRNEKWPFNLYTMIHAKDGEACREIARKLSEKTSIDKYILLFSQNELKKTSMNYFPSDIES